LRARATRRRLRVVRAGGEVLANVVASQMALHAKYGGVVPELASREHLRNIVPVVRARDGGGAAGVAELDAIAVTEGPGLAGALLVGITYAKALALGVGKPLIAVNHLEGHIHAVLMGARQRQEAMEMPMLALVVSGGTRIFTWRSWEWTPPVTVRLSRMGHPELWNKTRNRFPSGMTNQKTLWGYRNVGRTVDDAAGEAFDKVAKLLGLGYPGGPWMDALARSGNPRAVEFRFGQIKARRVGTNNDGVPVAPSGVHPTLSAEDAERMGHPSVVASNDRKCSPLIFRLAGSRRRCCGISRRMGWGRSWRRGGGRWVRRCGRIRQ